MNKTLLNNNLKRKLNLNSFRYLTEEITNTSIPTNITNIKNEINKEIIERNSNLSNRKPIRTLTEQEKEKREN